VTDGGTLVTVELAYNFDVWVGPASQPDAARPITLGGRSVACRWRSNGTILFEKFTGEDSIWTMDSDGKNSHELVADIASTGIGPSHQTVAIWSTLVAEQAALGIFGGSMPTATILSN
jgi:hypothetical protein